MSNSLTFNLTRLIVVAIVVSAGLVSMASTTERRIRFERGRSSATVTGRVPTGGRICYVAGARRGQLLEAYVSSPTGKVVIFESGFKEYAERIEVTGDQSICVDNLGKSSTYKLTISIR